VEPIGKDNFIQLAYQYSQNRSESDKDTRSRDESGNYTVLDSLYSKRLENNFVRQELEVNFKSVREKYDYMFPLHHAVKHSSVQRRFMMANRK